jgi:hypothetical protein
LRLLALDEITVRVAVPNDTPLACEVAITVTFEFGTAAGAMYKPVLSMLSQEPGHAGPERLHVTRVFFVPVTVAANFCWPEVTTFTLASTTVTTIGVPDRL